MMIRNMQYYPKSQMRLESLLVVQSKKKLCHSSGICIFCFNQLAKYKLSSRGPNYRTQLLSAQLCWRSQKCIKVFSLQCIHCQFFSWNHKPFLLIVFENIIKNVSFHNIASEVTQQYSVILSNAQQFSANSQ